MLRPLSDRLKISREKFAFLVDTTCAPVTAIAIVSTWLAAERGTIRETLLSLGIDRRRDDDALGEPAVLLLSDLDADLRGPGDFPRPRFRTDAAGRMAGRDAGPFEPARSGRSAGPSGRRGGAAGGPQAGPQCLDSAVPDAVRPGGGRHVVDGPRGIGVAPRPTPRRRRRSRPRLPRGSTCWNTRNRSACCCSRCSSRRRLPSPWGSGRDR